MPVAVRWRFATAGVGALVVLGAGVLAWEGASSAAPGPPTVVASATACAPGWRAPAVGSQQYLIRNQGRDAANVALVGGDGRTVFAEAELLAPGTERLLTVTVGPGRYSWQCGFVSGAASLSDPRDATGTGTPLTHSYQPVTLDELQPVVEAYRASVTTGLAQLQADTHTLAAVAATGDVAATQAAWLVAHLDYERLGAAYGTFGDHDGAINGRTAGLPGGAADPDFTGFHRLEVALWGGEPAATVNDVAQSLAADVDALVAEFPTTLTPPDDVSLRTHEILENTLQFELTGATDEGSHSNLATARANVDGTRMALSALTPLLAQRAPATLATATTGLDHLAALLDSYHRPDGSWTALAALTPLQRQQLDATTGGLLEQLAPIADLAEVLPVEGADG